MKNLDRGNYGHGITKRLCVLSVVSCRWLSLQHESTGTQEVNEIPVCVFLLRRVQGKVRVPSYSEMEILARVNWCTQNLGE